MIGWTVIRPLLLEVFGEVAVHMGFRADGFKAVFAERQAPFAHVEQRASLLLRITSVRGIGEDETRREIVGQELVESQTGQRRFTLQVQVRCPAADDERHAMAMLERIRMRLGRPRILERLLDEDVGIQRCGDAISLPGVKDSGREVDVANMDVVFNAVANEDDPIPVNWVQHIVLSSHLKEGTELEPPLQLVNAEVPTIL